MTTRSELRRAAMDLLARREHTRDELIEKLAARVRRVGERQRMTARRRAGRADATEVAGSLADAEAALLAEQGGAKRLASEDDATDTLDMAQLTRLAAEVVDQLTREGLQNDDRFVESFIAGRASRLYGPMRIRQELRQRGIPSEVIGEALASANIDWRAIQKQLVEQKFGRQPPADFKERARRLRFLQYRGFDPRDLDS